MNPDIATLLQQLLGAAGGSAAGMTTDPTTGAVTSDPSTTSGAGASDMTSLIAANPSLQSLFGNVGQNLGSDIVNGTGNENVQSDSGQTGAYSTLENELAQQLGLTSNSGTSNTSNTNANASATSGTTSGTNASNTTGTTTGTDTGTNASNTINQGVSNTANQQATTTGGTSTGTNAQNTATSGVQGQTTAGTSTTSPVDTLGMGSLLQAYQPEAAAATNAQNGFLLQSMLQGNPNLQQQVGQATSAALSGPGMTGTGNAAQARAAGTAASQVGINDFGQQLQAAQQLSGANPLTTLASASQPFIGSSTGTTGTGLLTNSGNTATSGSNTGTNTGYSNTAGTGTTSNLGSSATTGSSTNNTTGTNASNTTGSTTGTNASQTNGGSVGTSDTSTSNIGANLGSTLTNTSASGAATGQSAGTTLGEAPTSSSSGGGSYICTALVAHRLLNRRTVKTNVEYRLYKKKDRLLSVGYSVYGPWVAKLVLRSRLVRHSLLPLARAVNYEALRQARGRGRLRVWAKVVHAGFIHGSQALGFVLLPWAHIGTRDLTILHMLEQEGLLFQIHE